MAKPIIEQLLSEQHIRIQRDIEKSLLQAGALLQFALDGSLSEHPKDVLHDYLWAVSDIIEKAKECNRMVLDLFYNHIL